VVLCFSCSEEVGWHCNQKFRDVYRLVQELQFFFFYSFNDLWFVKFQRRAKRRKAMYQQLAKKIPDEKQDGFHTLQFVDANQQNEYDQIFKQPLRNH
jgi:hypothetical protein